MAIKLFKFSSGWGLPSTSSFCIKLETWLRMAKVEYEAVSCDDIRKAPKKKAPWIQDGGRTLGDSELIIEHVKQTQGVDLDARLSQIERARSLALLRLVEEHFHQVVTYTHFVHDNGWAHTRALFDFLPAPIRPLLRPHIRRAIRHQLYERGLGRHSHDEIIAMGKADIDALASSLGDQAYCFGSSPTTVDASVYGHLALTLWAPVESEIKQHLLGKPNLVAHCRRIAEAYYPEQVLAHAA